MSMSVIRLGVRRRWRNDDQAKRRHEEAGPELITACRPIHSQSILGSASVPCHHRRRKACCHQGTCEFESPVESKTPITASIQYCRTLISVENPRRLIRTEDQSCQQHASRPEEGQACGLRQVANGRLNGMLSRECSRASEDRLRLRLHDGRAATGSPPCMDMRANLRSSGVASKTCQRARKSPE